MSYATNQVPSAVSGELAGTPWVDVKDVAYGAKGDGTTDDTAAIQAAVTAAAAVNGGVLFPPGFAYLVTSTIAWNDSTVHFWSYGIGAKIVWNGNNSTPVFKGTGTSFFSFEDLWITGQPGVAGAKATAAIEIASSSGHTSYLGTFNRLQIGPGPGDTQSITFGAGLLFSGGVNNDGHIGTTIRIAFCDTGISNLQSQAIDQRWDEIRTLGNGTDFDLGAHTTIGTVELSGATTTNFNVSGGARVVCEKATSENSWRFDTITGSSMFTCKSGYYQASVQTTGTGGITSGLTTLVAVTGTFTSAMVGRTITIAGAGVAGAALVTTVASFTSSSIVDVTDAASTTVVGGVWTVVRIANDGFFVKGTDNATTQAVTLGDFDITQSASYAGPVPGIALHGNGGTSNKMLTFERLKASTAGFTTANLDVTPRSTTVETVTVMGTVFTAGAWQVILNVLSGSTTVTPSFTTTVSQIPDIQTFAIAPAAANPSTQGTGTWTKPSGYYTSVRCIAIGGGGGGGSGGAVAASTACSGGGGGGGAGRGDLVAPFSEFAATETIKVGGGGLGGSGVASGDGNAGVAGALSSMTKNALVFCAGRVGQGGNPGKGSAAAATGGAGGISSASGSAGQSSSASGAAASSAASGQAAAGGGAGGGVTAANPGATAAGSAGGTSPASSAGGAAGTAGSGAGGGNGGSGTDWSALDALPGVGGGGGGSESDSIHNGGAGGNGSLYGAGGGGGGACRPVGTTGAGGNGAGGIVVVISF